MNVLIIGGGGVVGQKLARNLAARGELKGQEITRLTLADINDPAPIDAPFPVDTATCDIADAASLEAVITADTDVVYLLAAIVSGHAEKDFDIGMRVNLFGTLNVFERCRALGTCPTVVYTSSLAVYGGDVPDPCEENTLLNPQTSYGMQKAVGELLITDFSRKGFLDGRGVRLPTISVRPGKANLAASSFMSSIIREPLNGKEAICPVGREFKHYYLSPKQCAENLVRTAEIPAEAMGKNRSFMMPGRTWSIGEMVDAMTKIAGPEPAKLIRWEAQPEIEKIVVGWRWDVRADKALSLGLEADASFEDNVRYYIEEDLPHAAGRG